MIFKISKIKNCSYPYLVNKGEGSLHKLCSGSDVCLFIL